MKRKAPSRRKLEDLLGRAALANHLRHADRHDNKLFGDCPSALCVEVREVLPRLAKSEAAQTQGRSVLRRKK